MSGCSDRCGGGAGGARQLAGDGGPRRAAAHLCRQAAHRQAVSDASTLRDVVRHARRSMSGRSDRPCGTAKAPSQITKPIGLAFTYQRKSRTMF